MRIQIPNMYTSVNIFVYLFVVVVVVVVVFHIEPNM